MLPFGSSFFFCQTPARAYALKSDSPVRLLSRRDIHGEEEQHLGVSFGKDYSWYSSITME